MIEQLRDYLYSDEWQEYVAAFIAANCDKFEVVSDEFTHEQYAAWKNFQEIAEQILEAALSEIDGSDFGGGLSSLERELDRISALPVTGPRDAKMKDILGQLLSFDSFPTFSYMMSQALQEKVPSDHNSAEHYDDGYTNSQRLDEQFWQGERGRDAKIGDPHVASQHQDYKTSSLNRDQERDADPRYLNELCQMGFDREVSRLVLANSEANTPLHELVATLSEMDMGSDAKNPPNGSYASYHSHDEEFDSTAYGPDVAHIDTNTFADQDENEFDGDMESPDDEDDGRHLEVFATAIGADAQDLSAKSALATTICESIKSGALVQETLHLFRWAHGLGRLLSEVHTCVLFHALQRISPEAINFDEWYADDASKNGQAVSLVQWYMLLEHDRMDAESRGYMGDLCSERELARMAELRRIADMGSDDERLLHTLIARHEETQREIEVQHQSCDLLTSVNGGVSREKLEEMYLFLKENVVSGDPVEVVSDKVYQMMKEIDPSGQNGSAVSLLLDMHLLENEQIALKTRINAILHDDVPLLEETVLSTASPSKSFAEPHHRDAKAFAPHTDDKENKQNDDGEGKDCKSSERTQAEREGTEYVSRLKKEHRDGLHRLQTVLQEEKAWKLGEMQAALKANKQLDDEDEMAARERYQAAMEILRAQLNEEEKSITAGYKQRCMVETKMVKSRVRRGASSEQWCLSDEDRERAAADAVKTLRDRHTKELEKLQELQTHSRSQRREKLLDRLRAKQNKRGAGGEKELKGQVTALLDEQDAEVFSSSLRPLLLSITAAELMDPTCIAAGLSVSDNHDDEDDDDEEKYLENEASRSDKLTDQLKKWIRTSVSAADHYTAASERLLGRHLQTSTGSITSGGEGSGDAGEGIGDDAGGRICRDMLRVVIGACASHSHDMVASGEGGHIGHPKGGLDADKIKQSIVEEYHRQKHLSDLELSHKKDKSREALERRRQQRNRDAKGSDDEAKSPLSSIGLELSRQYDDIVEAFLDEPLVISSPNKANGWTARTSGRAYSTSTGDKWGIGEDDDMGAENRRTGGSSVMKVLHHHQQSASKWAAEREANGERMDAIKASHNKHCGELTDDLAAQYNKRKNKMLLRLHSLQEQKNRKRDEGRECPADVKEYVGAVAAEREKLELLQKNYEDIINLAKTISPDALRKIGAQGLTKMLDPDNDQAGEDSGHESLQADSKAGRDSDDDAGGPAAGLSAKDLASWRREQSAVIHKESIEMQAKKITNMHNESMQKHEISMQLERSRQKTILQNKLLQRKTSSATTGAGYSSSSGTGLPAQMGLRKAPPGVVVPPPDMASRQMGLGKVGTGSFRGLPG